LLLRPRQLILEPLSLRLLRLLQLPCLLRQRLKLLQTPAEVHRLAVLLPQLSLEPLPVERLLLAAGLRLLGVVLLLGTATGGRLLDDLLHTGLRLLLHRLRSGDLFEHDVSALQGLVKRERPPPGRPCLKQRQGPARSRPD